MRKMNMMYYFPEKKTKVKLENISTQCYGEFKAEVTRVRGT